MPDRPSFPIPENLTPETCCLCIEMPQDPTWKAVISGLLFQPAEWFNWQRDEDKSGKELAQYWRKIYDNIDWSTMSCCCNDVPMARFSSDGHYQISNDGGATWTDAPNQDPRNSIPITPPALPSGTIDDKCTYADSVVEFFKQGVIDVIEEGNTVQQVIAIITGIIAAIFGAGGAVLAIIGALIGALAAGIVGLGITAVKGAFTTTVWNDLRCLIKNNINSDGSFTQEQIDYIYANVPGDTITQTILRSWIVALGIQGMSNSAHALYGSPDADCTDCDGHCVDVDFTVTDGDWFNIPREWGNPAGQWTIGEGWVATYLSHIDQNNELHINSPELGCPPGDYDIDVTFEVDTWYGYDVYVTFTVGAGGGSFAGWLGATGAGTYIGHYTGKTIPSGADFGINCTSNACDYRITAITITPSP